MYMMYGCHYVGLRGVLRKMRTRLRLIIHKKAGLIVAEIFQNGLAKREGMQWLVKLDRIIVEFLELGMNVSQFECDAIENFQTL